LVWLLVFILVIALILLLLLTTKLTISINYYHHNDNDDLQIEFRIWFGLIRYKKKIPFVKIDENSPSIIIKSKSAMGNDDNVENTEYDVKQFTKNDFLENYRRMNFLLKKVVHLHTIIKKFLQKISINKFEWQTMIGVGDAAHTAIVTGVLWSIKGNMTGLLSQYFKLKVMPVISITPHFQANVIQTRVSCIFQFRIGYAILAGLKMIKFWKGSIKTFNNKTHFSTKANSSTG
jgi:hypothetical protein